MNRDLLADILSGVHPLKVEVTYRKHEDYQVFLDEKAALQDKISSLDQELARMRMYADENLQMYDELKAACVALESAGLDTSYITSVRRRKKS